MEIYVKISFISTFLFFWLSTRIISDAFTRISASNTASDDVTN